MINLENLKIGVIILLGISALIMMILYLLSKNPIKTLLVNILFGATVLIILNFTTKYTGIRIPINPYTLIGCTVYGTPGVVGYLLSSIIFL